MLSRGLSYLAISFATIGAALSTHLNVTAINAKDGKSHFECWQLASPFITSNQSGLAGSGFVSLGDVTNITYNVVPSNFDSEFHTAPTNQWVVIINGLAVITLPDNSSTTVTTAGGELGLLFAADTATVSKRGHGNLFPGVTESIFLQIPTRDGEIPEHQVVYDDIPCTGHEYVGLRGWATGY